MAASYPTVPSPEQTAREAERVALEREWAEEDAMRYERMDDYNVFEEAQIFLDNEGGE